MSLEITEGEIELELTVDDANPASTNPVDLQRCEIVEEEDEEETENSFIAKNGQISLPEPPEIKSLLQQKKSADTSSKASIDVIGESDDLDDTRTEMSDGKAIDDLECEIDLREMVVGAANHAEELVKKIMIKVTWRVCHFRALPKWLQDNDFIHQGYRPPLPSFWECIKSIFSIHTETGNIWTHLLGCIVFLGAGAFFLCQPDLEIRFEEKMVFSAFFVGACICLGLSTAFHTFLCHSEWAGQLFSKLDYVGIALLIMGSFVPWLYYSFYCHFLLRIGYLTLVIVLGVTSIIVSLWPRFGEPKYRPLRAGLFMSFGLSGVIPAVHYSVSEGWIMAVTQASIGWLILMGLLYIAGTLMYAMRIPERFFPGKFDIWFQSHQIFHVFVVAAAMVHYHGISEMAMYRLSEGECRPQYTI